MLYCLVLYWPGLFVWFHDDDFAFLSLLPSVHSAHDLARAVFQPAEHGTWRPLSERFYCIGLEWLFGPSHALPFRIAVFLTQFANLALISTITLRLTGSRLAGFLAPITWASDAVLVPLMTWNATFMYALCGLVLLTSFLLLLRYIETSRRAYYLGMWAVFLSGFLVLETNVVFPALASAYTFLCARAYFRKTLPLFVPSILFMVLETWLIPKQSTGPYAPHFGPGMLTTLKEHWVRVFEPLNLATFTPVPHGAATIAMLLFSVCLIGFALCQAMRGNRLPLFFLCWFVIVIAPVLPLQEHIVDYYPALPSIGIAMLAAYAIASAFQQGLTLRMAASALLVSFLIESIPSARGGAVWQKNRSERVRDLILPTATIARAHPDKLILLDGIGDDLYGAALVDNPFEFLGLRNVFPAPVSAGCAPVSAPNADNERITAAADVLMKAQANRTLLVFRYAGNSLTDITSTYQLPSMDALDVTDPANAGKLGPTWFPVENGIRWMPRTASVRLEGLPSGCHQLYIYGYCAPTQLSRGPFRMTVRVNGQPFPPSIIGKAGTFEFEFPLSPSVQPPYRIGLELDHTVTTPPDARELGLAFGRFEIR